MKSISKLKDEARRHEQREEWEKAIQAYLQVIRNADEGEADVELPLYNRVGDLCVRLGKPQEAVRHYEQAADRYAEAGLYNNAIALCNKALRYNPDRLELIRKLGQFSASQGFITDARRYFLDYAERQFNAGKVTEALSALEDFANVSDDPEIREMLGRQLHAHGRINDAVDELQRAHAMRLQAGETQQAAALREEILAIDPNAVIDGAAPAPVESARSFDQDLPLVEIEPDPTGQEPGQAGIAGLESGALPGDTDVEPSAIELEGFDAGLADIEADADTGTVQGLETTTFDFGEVTEAPDLDDLGLEREETSFGTGAPRDAETFELAGPDAEDSTFDLPTLDEPGSTFDLPTLDEPEAEFDLPTLDEPEATFDLPTLDEPEAEIDLPTLDEPEATFDLPTLDEPEATFDLPTLDDMEAGSELPTLDETERTFDMPLLDEDGTASPDLAASPVPPPALDDEPSAAETEGDDDGMDLGGDLTLDLSAFGGIDASSFELPDTEDEPGSASWDAIAEQLESGDEDDVLDAPAWQPEPGPDFDLPSFEATAAEAEVEDITSSLSDADEDDPGVIEIPAIELPTWDTPSLQESEVEATEAAGESEPVWIETGDGGEDEQAAELPTFTYEEEPALLEDLEQDTDGEPELTADGDPLGLSAHLASIPVDAAAGDAADETDWLEDIADDDDADVAATAESEQAAEAPVAGGGEPDATISDVPVEDPAGLQRAESADGAELAESRSARPVGADEGYVDLGALVAEDDEVGTTRFRVQETAPTGDEDRDFAELLNQFKSKVQEHLPAEDAAAHYDLGLAFKEMGLIDEAIGEFQVALRAGHMRLRVYEELGDCFLQKEQYNIAEKVLNRALEMKFDDELELLGVYYHLGRAYEALGRRDQARDAYERVLGMDINFGDVSARLARL